MTAVLKAVSGIFPFNFTEDNTVVLVSDPNGMWVDAVTYDRNGNPIAREQVSGPILNFSELRQMAV